MFETMIQELVQYLPRIIGAAAIFVIFWFCGRMVKQIIMRIAEAGDSTRRDILRFAGQAINLSLLLIGFISALGTLGINVAALVAGLGLTGFALSFAFKDVLSNAVAGILILIYQPFKRDDCITISGHEGQVISVDLRYTTLQTDGGKVLIPNATLFSQSVKVKS